MSRRPGGVGGPGGPAAGGGVRGLVLLGVALLLGVFVLNQTDPGSSDTGSDEVSGSTATTVDEDGTAQSTLVPTSLPPPVRAAADVKVLPANGSGVAGLGGRVADRLKGRGYTNTLAAVNTSRDITASAVHYAQGFEPEARAVAEALGLPPTVARPLDSPPVSDTRGADVVVLIGPDLSTTATTAVGATTTTTRA